MTGQPTIDASALQAITGPVILPTPQPNADCMACYDDLMARLARPTTALKEAGFWLRLGLDSGVIDAAELAGMDETRAGLIRAHAASRTAADRWLAAADARARAWLADAGLSGIDASALHLVIEADTTFPGEAGWLLEVTNGDCLRAIDAAPFFDDEAVPASLKQYASNALFAMTVLDGIASDAVLVSEDDEMTTVFGMGEILPELGELFEEWVMLDKFPSDFDTAKTQAREHLEAIDALEAMDEPDFDERLATCLEQCTPDPYPPTSDCDLIAEADALAAQGHSHPILDYGRAIARLQAMFDADTAPTVAAHSEAGFLMLMVMRTDESERYAEMTHESAMQSGEFARIEIDADADDPEALLNTLARIYAQGLAFEAAGPALFPEHKES